MNLKARLFTVGIIGSLMVCGLGAACYWFSAKKEEHLKIVETISTMASRQAESGMLQQSIRGDIYAAVIARTDGNVAGIKSAKQDQHNHYEHLRQNIKHNQLEKVPGGVGDLFASASAAFENYQAAATAVIDAIEKGQDYREALRKFEERFVAVSKVSRTINQEMDSLLLSHEKEIEALEEFSGIVEIALLSLAVLAMFVTPFYVWRTMFVPQAALTEVMKKLASSDVSVTIPGLGRKDEIGEAARAVQVFKKNAIDKARLEDEQLLAVQKAHEDKKKAMQHLAARFESSVQGIIRAVSAEASELYKTSESMSTLINSANYKADRVSNSSTQTSQNVQSVASAIEEMSASVKEIAEQIEKSTLAVKSAVDEMGKADETSKSLEDATQRIGEIVDLIQNIAGQINLLALNATIESARAGEAGKGFAVVASEVKSLANQTTAATDEIASNINSIQNVSAQVVRALQSIKTAIRNVDEISAVISTAVEEQSSTTNEIASNMSNAASGTDQISSDIEEVSKASAEASQSAAKVLKAAKLLSNEAEKLNLEVGGFLSEIRQS